MLKVKLRWFLIPICFLLLFPALLNTPSAKCEDSSNLIPILVNFYITDINLQNHTLTADVDIGISGSKPLTVGNEEEPNNLTFHLLDINYDSVDFPNFQNLGNNSWQTIHRSLKNTQWYLSSFGEGYPYDINFAVFKISSNSLTYLVNSSDINSASRLNYTTRFFNSPPNVEFSGLNEVDLQRTWQLSAQSQGQELDFYLTRSALLPSVIIMIPLFWFLALTILIPLLCNERRTKREIFTALLVFLPIFLFAIQGYIPPRSSPSIPEFLIIMLMLLSTFMILISLRNFSRRDLCFIEGFAFAIALLFFVVVVVTTYSLLLAISPRIQFILFAVEVGLVLAVIMRNAPLIRDYINNRRTEPLTYSGFDGDY